MAEHHIVVTNFTHLTEEQLLFILQRRNHPDIRRWMAHPEPIAAPYHLAYCAALKDKPDTLYLYVTYDGQPACVITLHATDATWRELKDTGCYAFDPPLCSTAIIMNLIRWHLAVTRGTKFIRTLIKNANEMGLFANRFYYGATEVARDADYTHFELTFSEPPEFYQAKLNAQLSKLHATMDFAL